MKLWASIIKGLKKSKMANKLKKIRIFKRLREYKDREFNFRNNIQNLYIKIWDLKKELKDVSESFIKAIEEHKIEMAKIADKHEKASKHIAEFKKSHTELVKRRDEFLKRLKSKIPDEVIGGKFENYKYWLSEPFIVVKYEPYISINDRDVFIDPFSATRGIINIIDNKEEEDNNGKEEDIRKEE